MCLSISKLIALQSEEDFYIRYYTLQLLIALLTNSPNRYSFFHFGSKSFARLTLLLRIWAWAFLQAAGSYSDDSSWCHKAYGYAHGT